MPKASGIFTIVIVYNFHNFWLQDIPSLTRNLLEIISKYNDGIAINHIKIWVDGGKNEHVLQWLESLTDEMDSLLQYYNNTTTPPQDPPHGIHQLIQKYSQSPSFTSPLATKLRKTYEQMPIEKIRTELNRRKALQKRRQRTESATKKTSTVSTSNNFSTYRRNYQY